MNSNSEAPMKPELESALKLHQAGMVESALTLYASVLAADADNLAALYYGGVAAWTAGDYMLALDRLDRLISAAPQPAPEAYYHRALVHASLGNDRDAAGDYQAAVQLNPRFFAAHNNLGSLRRKLGDFANADASFAAALQIDPANNDARYNRALNAFDSGDLLRARTLLADCINLDPDNAGARATLVDVLHDLGNIGEALTLARAGCKRLPASALLWNALGNVEEEAGSVAGAMAAYRTGLKHEPGNPRIAMNLMHIQNANAEMAAALQTCEAALAANEHAGLRFRRATLLPVIPSDEDEIDASRSRFSAALASLRAANVRLDDPLNDFGEAPFYLSYHGRGNDRILLGEFASTLRQAAPSIVFTAAHVERPRRPGKPRIGVCSHFLFDHSVGRALHAIIAALSGAEFELHIFLVPPFVEDALARKIRSGAAVHRLPLNLGAARDKICAAEIDLLLYPEIGCDALTYYLAHARLARAQWTTLGHPCTSGLPTIDTYVSYASLEPEGSERFYSETLLRLPEGLPFPAYPADELPDRMRDRKTLGLPTGRALLICPQSLFKLMPVFDTALAAILDAAPTATLLIPEARMPGQTAAIKARFAKSLGAAAKRVRFFPRRTRSELVELIAACDLMLDPFPVSGGITTWDMLATGTPIVTLPGQLMRSRFACSALTAAGISQTMAADETGYAATVAGLLQNKDEPRVLRAQLASAAPAIYADTRAIPAWLDAVRQSVHAA